MQIKDESVTQIAHPEIYVSGGTMYYEMNFKCDHSMAVVIKDEHPFAPYSVICLGCRGNDLTELDIEDLIAQDIENNLIEEIE